jgi:hypothetical protein
VLRHLLANQKVGTGKLFIAAWHVKLYVVGFELMLVCFNDDSRCVNAKIAKAGKVMVL